MDEIRERKVELRRQVLRARRQLTDGQRRAAALALATTVRRLPECVHSRTVAAYVSVGSEPGTGPLIEVLRSTGVRVLLPVLRADNDLDWAEYRGQAALARTSRGLMEPTGPRLGIEAVTEVQSVLLPGLAVDARGVRLGRGGGSYDRVLSRLEQAATHPSLIVVLYQGEVVEAVPAEPHDRRVDIALTPSGVRRFPS